MIVYTGSPGGSETKMSEMGQRGMGIMLSSEASRAYSKFPCALDNGAFEAYRRGFPWSESRFMHILDKAWSSGLKLNFIVCPDIVAGGVESLDFSMHWAPRLKPAKLALAVQDGMVPADLSSYHLRHFSYLFVGGSVDWKWQTAKSWADFAHARGLMCHVGRVGALPKLRFCRAIGVDSVDSTSFVRNDSWHIIDELNSPPSGVQA